MLQSAHQEEKDEESVRNESRTWLLFLRNLSCLLMWKHYLPKINYSLMFRTTILSKVF